MWRRRRRRRSGRLNRLRMRIRIRTRTDAGLVLRTGRSSRRRSSLLLLLRRRAVLGRAVRGTAVRLLRRTVLLGGGGARAGAGAGAGARGCLERPPASHSSSAAADPRCRGYPHHASLASVTVSVRHDSRIGRNKLTVRGVEAGRRDASPGRNIREWGRLGNAAGTGETRGVHRPTEGIPTRAWCLFDPTRHRATRPADRGVRHAHRRT